MRDTHSLLKRSLYTLCFAALSALDFVRNTQNGDIWGVAVNLTGFIMLVIIASAWPLKKLLTIRNVVWTLTCAGVCIYAPISIRSTGMDIFWGMYVWTFVSAVANVWWIAIFLAEIILTRVKISQFPRCTGRIIKQPALTIVWIVMSVLMVCSRSGRI